MRKVNIILILILFFLCSFKFPDEKEFLAQKIADVEVFDSKGNTYQISDLLGEKPVLISPIYTKCYSLCGVISGGLQTAINDIGTAGKDFYMISFSFDSTDTYLDLAEYEERWKMDGKNWRVLSASGENIIKLMESIGYEYDYIPDTKEYSHPSILITLTPSGRISRYVYGVNPKKKDIKISVMEAMAEKTRPGLFIGFYLRCFGYDPALRTYKMDWRFILSTSAGLIMITIMTRIFLKTFIISKDE